MALYNVIKRTIQTTAGLRDGLTIVEPDRMTRLCYYILYSTLSNLAAPQLPSDEPPFIFFSNSSFDDQTHQSPTITPADIKRGKSRDTRRPMLDFFIDPVHFLHQIYYVHYTNKRYYYTHTECVYECRSMKRWQRQCKSTRALV